MSKDKSIDTPELLIKGNIMSWEGMMIQLSNISCISTSPIDKLEFPKISLLLMIVGFISIFIEFIEAWIGLCIIASGIVWLLFWHYLNEIRKYETNLDISMNSGNTLRIIFSDRRFLEVVLRVLERIIIDGGIGEHNISISINDCNITGNAKVLNDLNLS